MKFTVQQYKNRSWMDIADGTHDYCIGYAEAHYRIRQDFKKSLRVRSPFGSIVWPSNKILQ